MVQDVTVQDRRARLISVLLLVLTLAVGFMFGLAWSARQPAGDVSAAEEAQSAAEPEAEEPEAEEADMSMGRGPVIYELGLEADQRAGVDEIIRHFRSRMRALNEEAREEYDRRQSALLMTTRDSIKAILNPGQIAEYDSLLAVRYSPNRDGRGDSRRERRRDDRPEE